MQCADLSSHWQPLSHIRAFNSNYSTSNKTFRKSRKSWRLATSATSGDTRSTTTISPPLMKLGSKLSLALCSSNVSAGVPVSTRVAKTPATTAETQATPAISKAVELRRGTALRNASSVHSPKTPHGRHACLFRSRPCDCPAAGEDE